MIIESGLRGVEEGAVNVSQFNLIDLAGSERARQTGATGARLKESININQSLLGLSRVIRQLSENENQFISYRDSKLTRILQNSLGGNALTAIICTITSACLEETISTLKNKPQVNEVLNEQALLKQYANKIKKLTAELEATKEEKSQENKNLQEKIKYLTKQFVFQMNPAHKTKNVRRETWGGTLDAARLRMQLAPKKSFVPVPIEDTLSDLTSFNRNHPKSRPRSLENYFPPLKSKSSSTQSSFGSRNLSILEEECEDFNLLDGDDIFSNSHHQHSKKSSTKRTSTLCFTNATVQTVKYT
ncbi:centromere-associated protein E [Caerostris extrusa]|uniref:Kinesin-like protein n=1 Tax=Caerostris extrusa TaxID=172846 RepID=A0AAV4SFI5_CAEEX|nr:centromere-associated protein E [Caerostris extrusa]